MMATSTKTKTDKEWFLEHFGKLTKDHQQKLETIAIRFRKYWRLVEKEKVYVSTWRSEEEECFYVTWDSKHEPYFDVEIKDPSKIYKVEKVRFLCYADRIEVIDSFGSFNPVERSAIIYKSDKYTMTIENFFKYLDQLTKGPRYFAECTNEEV